MEKNEDGHNDDEGEDGGDDGDDQYDMVRWVPSSQRATWSPHIRLQYSERRVKILDIIRFFPQKYTKNGRHDNRA